MTPQEMKFRQYHTDIVAAFVAAFPGVDPPAASWIQIWLTRYSVMGVLAAIRHLQNYPPQVKARYSQESVGRAISSLLRASAIKRSVVGTPSTKAVSR
jgi:hypothetical protein